MTPSIPKDLSEEQVEVYRSLRRVHDARERNGTRPSRVFVISDIAKDCDDLVAWIILKELHRFNIIELVGFIANLKPTYQRARYGRGALDALGLKNIPIAQGLDAVTKAGHKAQDHEFKDCTFMAPEGTEFESGEDLLYSVLADAKTHKYQIQLLLISSLTDIAKFSQIFPKLLTAQVSEINMQGGYTVDSEDRVTKIENAANNSFDPVSAKIFHNFISDHKIKTTVYTKVAALAQLPIFSRFFQELKDIGHVLGKRLFRFHRRQEINFYEIACNDDPTKRFQPWMDKGW